MNVLLYVLPVYCIRGNRPCCSCPDSCVGHPHKMGESHIIVFPCGRDEELLAKGLELNDSLQSLLAKHDAIVSGSPLPAQLTDSSPQRTETSASSVKQSEVRDSSPRPNVSPSAPVTTLAKSQIYEEEEEEEDEFAQLARRFHATSLLVSLDIVANFPYQNHYDYFL